MKVEKRIVAGIKLIGGGGALYHHHKSIMHLLISLVRHDIPSINLERILCLISSQLLLEDSMYVGRLSLLFVSLNLSTISKSSVTKYYLVLTNRVEIFSIRTLLLINLLYPKLVG